MNQATKAAEAVLDLDRHLREPGRTFAPCGAIVLGGTHAPVQPSTDDILRVTCLKCRAHIRTLGRAYQMARRRKLIDW